MKTDVFVNIAGNDVRANAVVALSVYPTNAEDGTKIHIAGGDFIYTDVPREEVRELLAGVGFEFTGIPEPTPVDNSGGAPTEE